MAKRKPKRKRTPARRNLDRSKSHERRVARWFGTVRTPLSGGASRHTRSDTLHPKLYVEVKGAQGPTGTNGWLWRFFRDRNCALGQPAYADASPLVLRAIPCADLGGMRASDGHLSPVVGFPSQMINLWWDTVEKAQLEKKTPVLALVLKGRRGFWLVAVDLGAVKRARVEALRGEA